MPDLDHLHALYFDYPYLLKIYRLENVYNRIHFILLSLAAPLYLKYPKHAKYLLNVVEFMIILKI